MKGLLLLVFIIVLGAMPYVWNGYKLAGCDFEPNYKCEVIHGIGVLIPPASLFTVWFDSDRR